MIGGAARIRTGTVGQRPFGEPKRVDLHRIRQEVPRARSIPSHADHGPLGIAPVVRAAKRDGALVHQVQQPDEIVVGEIPLGRMAGERVVEELHVVRLRAAGKQ